jgi:hypothetical protein
VKGQLLSLDDLGQPLQRALESQLLPQPNDNARQSAAQGGGIPVERGRPCKSPEMLPISPSYFSLFSIQDIQCALGSPSGETIVNEDLTDYKQSLDHIDAENTEWGHSTFPAVSEASRWAEDSPQVPLKRQ